MSGLADEDRGLVGLSLWSWMFRFFHNKKVNRNIITVTQNIYNKQTIVITLQRQECLEVRPQTHSVVWLSVSALDFLPRKHRNGQYHWRAHPLSTRRAQAHVSPRLWEKEEKEVQK